MKKLTEQELWKLIESADWKSDYDYERIQELFSKLPKSTFEQLSEFYGEKHSALYDKFESDWLGDPGIPVGDDSWSDLTAEVVGRGQRFYNAITAKKLRKMAITYDYMENFGYSFQVD